MNNEIKKTIVAKDIVKRYSENKGVGPVSLSLNTNSIYSVIGSNASGKTTLVKCLSKAENLDSGEIFYFPTEDNSIDHLLYSLVFSTTRTMATFKCFAKCDVTFKKSVKSG